MEIIRSTDDPRAIVSKPVSDSISVETTSINTSCTEATTSTDAMYETSCNRAISL